MEQVGSKPQIYINRKERLLPVIKLTKEGLNKHVSLVKL